MVGAQGVDADDMPLLSLGELPGVRILTRQVGRCGIPACNYLAKNLQVSYEPDAEVTLVFQGEKDTLDSLDISNAVSVNLQNYTKEGTYDIPVEVDLPDGVTLTKPVSVQLVLTEKESTEDEQPENNSETN